MITAIGKELKRDPGYSATENLYFQLFGEWPEHDCVAEEATAMLKSYLNTLCEADFIETFFGIDAKQSCVVVDAPCIACTSRSGCKYRENGQDWLKERVEEQLEKLRQDYAREFKLLYLDWGSAEAYQGYSKLARHSLALALANKNREMLVANLQSELHETRELVQRTKEAEQEREERYAELEAKNERLVESEAAIRTALLRMTNACETMARQNIKLVRMLGDDAADDSEDDAEDLGDPRETEYMYDWDDEYDNFDDCGLFQEAGELEADLEEDIDLPPKRPHWVMEPIGLLTSGTIADLELPAEIEELLYQDGIDWIRDMVVVTEAELVDILASEKKVRRVKRALQLKNLTFVDSEQRERLLAEGKLGDLELSQRAYWSLRILGFETVAQLVSLSHETLQELFNRSENDFTGPEIQHEICRKLVKFGLGLATEEKTAQEQTICPQDRYSNKALLEYLALPFQTLDISENLKKTLGCFFETIGDYLICPLDIVKQLPAMGGCGFRSRIHLLESLVGGRSVHAVLEHYREELLNPTELILDSINELLLSDELICYFCQRGINTKEDLVTKTEHELRIWLGHNFERTKELKMALLNHNLTLADEPPFDNLADLETLLAMPIGQLGLSGHAVNNLCGLGISKISELVICSPQELMAKKGIAQRTVSQIEATLYRRGLILRYDHNLEEWVEFYHLETERADFLAKAQIKDLAIAPKTCEMLEMADIQTVAQLVEQTSSDLIAKGLNGEGLRSLKWALARKGLQLAK